MFIYAPRSCGWNCLSNRWVYLALSKLIETDSFARCDFLQNFYEKIECRQIWQGSQYWLHTKKIQSSFLLGRKSFNSLAYQNKGIAYMKLCLWDKGNEFWCKFLPDMKLRRCVFSSLQIKNTCLNINMEIIMFNVVILSGSWRNISIFQWVVFLFSRENLNFFFAFLISTHFTFAQNRNRGGWSVLKFLKYFNFLGGKVNAFFCWD